MDAPFVFTGNKISTVKVAFGTTIALGLSQACGTTGAAVKGFYGETPDVTVTFE